MTYKELSNQILTRYNAMSNALQFTPGSISMDSTIKDIPLETLQEYATKNGETISPARLDGTVTCCINKITEFGIASISLISERHKVILEKL